MTLKIGPQNIPIKHCQHCGFDFIHNPQMGFVQEINGSWIEGLKCPACGELVEV